MGRFNNSYRALKSPERYISCKVIIDKVYRDLNLEEDGNDRWVDMIEWMGEAIELIHIHYTLQKKTATLTVKDFKANLPCDYYSMIMVKPTGGFASRQSPNPFDYSDNHPKSLQSHYVEYPYLKLAMQEGEVDISYHAFPMDSENFPMIPDNAYVKEALEWYVLKKMIMGGFKHPDPTFSFLYCNDQWKEYCAKAKADYRMPNLAQMESLKAMWIRLKPMPNAHNNGFANLNVNESWEI
jgi:hypothetical protein